MVELKENLHKELTNMKELTLFKAVVVIQKDTLGREYSGFYHENHDMYIFSSEASYIPDLGSYTGVRLLHDRILRENNLSDLDRNKFNYISVDIRPSDKYHTYLSINRRGCSLSSEQVDFLKNYFNSDY